ncbi:MAG: TatD family hydrolase [Spirochaetota bacterium]
MNGSRQRPAPYHIVPGSVDSHFHSLVMDSRGLDVEHILSDCFEAGLAYGLDISVSLDDFSERRRRLAAFDRVFLTAGYHPSATDTHTYEAVETELRARLHEEGVVALGEIGLDQYRDYGDPARQTELFVAQVELARELDLPVVVHNRDADRHILDIFRTHPPTRESVMHCFSADAGYAAQYLELGFTLSFGGNVTYKRSQHIREAARITPADRLLVETDAPFLAPQPVRGRPNHPGFVGYTYEFLAELRGESSVEELARTVAGNFERIFLKS